MAGWQKYFRAVFSTGFSKGNADDMIQLLEFSCAIWDGVKLLQGGACPL